MSKPEPDPGPLGGLPPLWPVAECTHPAEYRDPGATIVQNGEIVRRIPEHCTACGYSIAPPRDADDDQ